MSKKGDKTTSMEIPPWLSETLKPYITDAVSKGQRMSDAAWNWGMRNNPNYGASPEDVANPNQPVENVFTVEGIPKYPGDTIPGNRG